MKKKGISHIEVVLSFIIFVVAVSFALFIFSPFDSDRLVDSSLIYGFREIEKSVSIEMRSYSFEVTLEELMSDPIAVRLEGIGENPDFVSWAQHHTGSVLPSERNGDVVYVMGLGEGWLPEDFFYIKLADDFEQGEGVNLVSVDEEIYSIASSDVEDIISEKRVKELKDSYMQDYFLLKEEFNLPDRVNFGFSLVFGDNDEIVAERVVPQGLEVFSDSKRVKVLREDNNVDEPIEFADLIVKVW